jgi:hypothetical protein
LKDGEERSNVSMKGDDFDWPRDIRGMPAIKITCAAAELVPTVQYGNVTVGPISVTRFVVDLDDDEDLLKQINRTQAICEQAVAEERKTVQILMRSRVDRAIQPA